jgi:hypothetical protein
MPRKIVKRLAELPEASGEPAVPRLEAEAPHRKLARLTKELRSTTEALQALKHDWAERNVKAQACRQAVSTPEVTHFETQKRTLALRIQEIQTQIGATNKALRERKSERQAGRAKLNQAVREPKAGPLKTHPEYLQYFFLAAQNELTREMLAQIERTAKAMLHDATTMGVEEAS